MKIISLITLFAYSSIATAGVHCSEKIRGAILHKNSNVYFTTDTTCESWCQIKWTGEGDKNRALSMLIASKTTDKSITFYWENISSCDVKNVTYESPGYIVY
ncbi:hypothetical protein [Psychromonas sp. Urea-02u-13]|uniref:hypothetical protein n=1 Tax=Psychromonas sp. Urea-02u-13 TaxID=2058326 RepID=UPI000C34E3B8|nr:hypothetical protein [Psychromonas sp. Urea-02u-13]PKG37054.1 hypothetical protein CXF74_20910 [Psychromonas sp. Urea-02u-13]